MLSSPGIESSQDYLEVHQELKTGIDEATDFVLELFCIFGAAQTSVRCFSHNGSTRGRPRNGTFVHRNNLVTHGQSKDHTPHNLSKADHEYSQTYLVMISGSTNDVRKEHLVRSNYSRGDS